MPDQIHRKISAGSRLTSAAEFVSRKAVIFHDAAISFAVRNFFVEVPVRSKHCVNGLRGENFFAVECASTHQHFKTVAQLPERNAQSALRFKNCGVRADFVVADIVTAENFAVLKRRQVDCISERAGGVVVVLRKPRVAVVALRVKCAELVKSLVAEIAWNVAAADCQLLKNILLLIAVETFAGDALNDRAEYAVIQVAVAEKFSRTLRCEVCAVLISNAADREEFFQRVVRRENVRISVAQGRRVACKHFDCYRRVRKIRVAQSEIKILAGVVSQSDFAALNQLHNRKHGEHFRQACRTEKCIFVNGLVGCNVSSSAEKTVNRFAIFVDYHAETGHLRAAVTNHRGKFVVKSFHCTTSPSTIER